MTRKPRTKPAATAPRPPAEGGSYVREADGSLTKVPAQSAAAEAAPAKDED